MRGVYAAVFERPNKDELIYVGSARVLERRWAEHERKLRRGVHENTKFQNAYNKYRQFRWEVLEQLPGADEDELVAAERRWYDKLLAERGRENLLNLMRPEKCPMYDPEVRERQRVAASEFVKQLQQDPEFRERAAAGWRRKLAEDPEFAAVHAEQARERILKLNQDPANAERMRKRHQDPEFQERRRAAAVAANVKRYIVTSPKGEVIEVVNLSRFCREIGLNTGTMVGVAQGKFQQHKGWKCRYAEEEPI